MVCLWLFYINFNKNLFFHHPGFVKIFSVNNYAFVDGQNLHLGTLGENWKIDFKKFRIYLKDKYSVEKAYYFLGFESEEQIDLYNNLEKAGFFIIFKSHNPELQAKKKGNVDTDVVFEIMKNLVDDIRMDKVILVSGDGDYKKLVDYLISKDKFLKILFPSEKFASSLYKVLTSKYYDYLDNSRNLLKR
jgi:uncharacterized LabA/DUF88 family protein